MGFTRSIRSFWRLWAKALGEKDGRNDREANIIAGIRTFILGAYMVTNCFIAAGVVRHWNDGSVAESVDAPDLKSVGHSP